MRRGGGSGVRTSCEEGEARCSSTVGQPDGASELYSGPQKPTDMAGEVQSRYRSVGITDGSYVSP